MWNSVGTHLGSLWTSIKWFVTMGLGEGGTISFGRSLSLFWSLYFAAIDWSLFAKSGHLVDNATLLTQLTVITTSYAITKASDVIAGAKNDLKV